MNKCQQFIDKVSELKFLKIKERQVHNFNRLLLKKEGNITWFYAVPPKQKVLVPRQPVPLPLKQVVPRQPALTPREIALSPHRQVDPGQRVLMPRQPAPLPSSLH